MTQSRQHTEFPTPSGEATLHTRAGAANTGSCMQLAGHIDAAVARTIRRLAGDIDPATQLTIDLTGVTSIDATGFAAIAATTRIGDADHTPTIMCVSGPIRHLLNITLLDQDVNVDESDPAPDVGAEHSFVHEAATIPRRRRRHGRRSGSTRHQLSQADQIQGLGMATHYDFTKIEWEHVASTPVLAGLAVAKAEDSGFIGSLKESRELVTQLAAKVGSDNPAHQLIAAAVATDTRVQTASFKALAPATLAETAVTACAELARLLSREATTAEAAAYKAWILTVAGRVADAATESGVRVSPKEAALLERMSQALA